MPLLIGKTRGILYFRCTAKPSWYLPASYGILRHLMAYLNISLHLSAYRGISRHLAASRGISWHLVASRGILQYLLASHDITLYLVVPRGISYHRRKPVSPLCLRSCHFVRCAVVMPLPCASSLFYQLPWLWSCSILLSKTWALNHARLQIT